jgi:SAM-dependent methyltransferase
MRLTTGGWVAATPSLHRVEEDRPPLEPQLAEVAAPAAGAERPRRLFQDRVRAGSFGEDAELYDRARPRYPLVAVDRLVSGRPRTVLDVGCGTGIASRDFAARGLDVLGVEPDPRMAAVARRHGLVVEASAFETWVPGDRHFDLLISAQAWHWVDPEIGVAKAAQVVVPGGGIGLFWNVGRPPGDLRQDFDRAYTSWAPGLEDYSVLLGRGELDRHVAAAEQLRANSSWGDIEVTSYPSDVTYRTDQWLEHLQTHSDHRGLPPDRRRGLLDQIAREIDGQGGSFVMHYETMLATATRTRA